MEQNEQQEPTLLDLLRNHRIPSAQEMKNEFRNFNRLSIKNFKEENEEYEKAKEALATKEEQTTGNQECPTPGDCRRV